MNTFTGNDSLFVRRSIWTLAIAALIGVGLYALVGIYAIPLADDLCLVASANELGIVGSVHWTYWNWTGNIITLYYQVIAGQAWLYALNPLFLLVLWVFGFAWLAWEILGSTQYPYRRALAVLTGAVLTLAVFDAAPNLVQSLYWITGTAAYSFPSALIIYLAALSVRTLRLGFKRNIGWSALLLAFVIGCSSPTHSAFVLGLLFVGSTLLLIRGLPNRRGFLWFIIFALVGGFIAAAIILLSPGNAIRQTALSEYGIQRQSLGSAIVISSVVALYMVSESIISYAPVSIIGLIIMAIGLTFVVPITRSVTWRQQILAFIGIIVITFGVFAGSMFPVALSIAAVPAARLWHIPQSVWLPVLAAITYIIAARVGRGASNSARRRAGVVTVAMIVVFLGAQAIQVLSFLPDIRMFHEDFWQRVALVEEAVAQGRERVTVSSPRLNVIKYAELSDAMTAECFSQYYGIDVDAITSSEEAQQ